MLLYLYVTPNWLNHNLSLMGTLSCINDAMVKYTLGDKAKQIFARKYQFYLPSEEELEKELRKEIASIKHHLKEGK